jgi:hypothetical protein
MALDCHFRIFKRPEPAPVWWTLKKATKNIENVHGLGDCLFIVTAMSTTTAQ